MVLCCLFLVVSEFGFCFPLCLFVLFLVPFWLLSGHLLEKSYPTGIVTLEK